ncbi:MAG: hypothetical protein ETSY1_30505 [Candidatus Entotheonella factor]|uniref:Uncharacterized protein n=1 Tax=Entotheonella factor TaxID=1429438 RepID=W4LC34_ENTF1|nr:MAG: hypothetical protein ETSY1_30505 [Candidatus Entotheonella factor]
MHGFGLLGSSGLTTLGSGASPTALWFKMPCEFPQDWLEIKDSAQMYSMQDFSARIAERFVQV